MTLASAERAGARPQQWPPRHRHFH